MALDAAKSVWVACERCRVIERCCVPPTLRSLWAGGRDQLFLADTLHCFTPSMSDACRVVWGRGDRTPFPVTGGVPTPGVQPARFVTVGGVGSSPWGLVAPPGAAFPTSVVPVNVAQV